MILFIRLNQTNEIDKNNKINRGSRDVQDREEAGQRLADRLTRYRDDSAAIILALPRGGVAVGYQLSRGLHLPLDVFITSHGRKGLSRFLLGGVSCRHASRHLSRTGPPVKGSKTKTTLPLAAILISVLTSVVFAQVIRGDAKAGQGAYEQQCLRCHGAKLDGNGPDSQDLIVRPADLRSQNSRSKTDWELLVAISNGVLFSPMHGFRGKLTDQQMLDVLSYIKSMSPPDITS